MKCYLWLSLQNLPSKNWPKGRQAGGPRPAQTFTRTFRKAKRGSARFAIWFEPSKTHQKGNNTKSCVLGCREANGEPNPNFENLMEIEEEKVFSQRTARAGRDPWGSSSPPSSLELG